MRTQPKPKPKPMGSTTDWLAGKLPDCQRRPDTTPRLNYAPDPAAPKLPDALTGKTADRCLQEAVASKDAEAIRTAARAGRSRMRPDQHALLDDLAHLGDQSVDPPLASSDAGEALLEAVAAASQDDELGKGQGSVTDYISRHVAKRAGRV